MSDINWSGEGLPPVGIECLIFNELNNEFTRQFNGKRVLILAHEKKDVDNVAVFKVLGRVGGLDARYHSLVERCFLPILTPEQDTEEERESQVSSLQDVIVTSVKVNMGQCDFWRKVAEMVLDAGFSRDK